MLLYQLVVYGFYIHRILNHKLITVQLTFVLFQTLILPCACFLSILRGNVTSFQVQLTWNRFPVLWTSAFHQTYLEHESYNCIIDNCIRGSLIFSFVAWFYWQWLCCMVIIIVGVVSSAFGTYSALSQIIEQFSWFLGWYISNCERELLFCRLVPLFFSVK